MKALRPVLPLAVASLLPGCAAPRDSAATQPAATAAATAQPRRVTGVGGIFFTAQDPAAMRHWYATHLGLRTDEWGTNFEWRQAEEGTKKGFTQWGPFAQRTTYFQPSAKPFMINYRVENLEWLLAQLKTERVTVVGDVKVEPYGKFAWIMDPEGNKVELWEPNDVAYDKMVPAEGRTK